MNVDFEGILWWRNPMKSHVKVKWKEVVVIKRRGKGLNSGKELFDINSCSTTLLASEPEN